jgi:hypothetical protein
VLTWLGWLLMGMGVLANEWVLTTLLSADGIVEIHNRVAIWLFDLLFLSLGLVLVMSGTVVRSREGLRHFLQTYPRTCAVAIGMIVTVILLVSAEGIFYGINYYSRTQLVADVTWSRLPATQAEADSASHVPAQGHGWAIDDPVLGYRLPPNAQITATLHRGETVSQHTYTTDAFQRRFTPVDHVEQRQEFLLFFGCSMTFGLGVQDDETMPFYAGQYAPHSRPYNYGVSGYGPHHVLAQLQSAPLTHEIPEKHGIAVYTFIDHHIDRAIGTMRVYNQWEQHAPYYMLDAHERLVRKGDFSSGRPVVSLLYWILGKSQILQYYGIRLPVRIREEHIRLTARIIVEAHTTFHQQFPDDAFYVLLYPGVSRGRALLPYLERAGVPYLDYSRLIDWPHPGLTLPGDAHPTAQGHRMVAAHLAKDVGIFEGNAQQSASTKGQP